MIEYDQNQLLYSPTFYPVAFARLTDLGFVIKGRRIFDWSGYHTRTAEQLQRTGADYVVFERCRLTGDPLSFPVAFENAEYRVYSLK